MDWLLVSALDLTAINLALPATVRVSSVVTVGGQPVIGADLLTDCAAGQTYEAAGGLLSGLSVISGEPDES